MTKEDLHTRISTLAEERLAEWPGLFLVEVHLSPSLSQITVSIDGDAGVPIEACASVSRNIGHHLEEEDLLENPYHLTVQSPGVGTPLRLPRQYAANMGRALSVLLQNGTKATGTLTEVAEAHITLETTVKEKGKKAQLVPATISFADIKEAKVEINFKERP